MRGRSSGEQHSRVHEGGAVLIGLSADGRFFLTRGYRKKPGCEQPCRNTVLAVYDTASRDLVRELVVEDTNMVCVRFVGQHAVRFLQRFRFETLDLMEWDPVSGKTTSLPFLASTNMTPACMLEDSQTLARGFDAAQDYVQLAVLTADASRHAWRLPLTTDAASVWYRPGGPYESAWRNNCNAWQSGTRFLVKSLNQPNALMWLSSDPSAPPEKFRDFPGEQIYGYAISPDRKLIAVVTARTRNFEEGPGSPGNPAFLHVDDAQTGAELGKFQMEFPEKPLWKKVLINPSRKYVDNYRFEGQFAWQVAISPDRKTIAVSYGVFRDPDGIAFFGLYALSDGHRLATVRGDTLVSGWWWAITHNSEEVTAHEAPLWGAMEFSPDSHVLYATSDHLHLWDVSRL
jgi:hypothetical protein